MTNNLFAQVVPLLVKAARWLALATTRSRFGYVAVTKYVPAQALAIISQLMLKKLVSKQLLRPEMS